MPKLLIDNQPLSYEELQEFYKHFDDMAVSLDDELFDAINASAEEVNRVLAADKVVYGINTGFGMLASKKIPSEDLRTLQKSLVLSHATGVADELSHAEVALVILLKVQSLTRGYSGIRLLVIERLIAFINHGIYPCIPSKGSVGASGDLAPLA
ncbi:MAG: aromatic amino acid lyase, partial [Gammaproteobacteria bacterium]|nr:aromatic amino acid lyase [Gammaproteobacteria bacterium]